MAAVLPESMDKLDLQDTAGSLGIIEQYIRYMGERIDFAMRGMGKSISEAGVSSLTLYQTLVELSGSLSSMQGALNRLSGSVTALQTQVNEISGKVSSLETALGELEGRVAALENQNGG